MKLISVNVAQPIEIFVNGRSISTGIFKQPVRGPVRVRRLNLDGDRQADLTVHGGPDKAVYAYPSEHYESWRRELDHDLFGWGTFGENLTLQGLFEDTVHIGDQIGIGTVLFEVSQPRQPCFKLAAKFEREDMITRFLHSRRSGFYFRVLQEGSLQADDPIEFRNRDPHAVTVREIMDLYAAKKLNQRQIERALSVEALSDSWREHFLRRQASREP